MAVIGTFGSFTAARLGIYASQSSLNVTGNNISNINTEGYTRQRLDLVSLHSYGNARYHSGYNLDIGYGVLADGASQLRDPFLDIRYRDMNASVGAYEARTKGLEQLSDILDEVGQGKQGFGIIEDAFNTFVEMLNNRDYRPGSDDYDTLVRESAQTLTNYFNSYADSLKVVKDNLTEDLKEDVDTVNNILEQIRDLNVQIRDAGIFGDKALELRDARNLLIDKLSGYMKIEVRYDMEKVDEFSSVERINISIADSGTPPIKLVQGIYATQIDMPEMAAMRNPNYNPDLPSSNRYISQESDLKNGITRYTNSEREAMRNDDGSLMLNPAYDLDLETSGKYLILNADGSVKERTEDADAATQVPNALKRTDERYNDDNRLWMSLKPLVDEKGRYMRDEYHQEIKETVDLSDVQLYGSLQSKRELITEEGEFASEDDVKFDADANIKRGVPYYQHALDALAQKFAKMYNEANQLNFDQVKDAYQTNAGGNFKDIQDADILGVAGAVDGQPLSPAYFDGVAQKIKDLEADTTLSAKDREDQIAALKEEAYKNMEQLRLNGQLTEAWSFYKGGVMFSNKGDGNDPTGITAANITIAKAWSTGAVRTLHTKEPIRDGIDHTTLNDNIFHMVSLMDQKLDYRAGTTVTDAKNGGEIYFSGSYQEMLANINLTLGMDQNTSIGQYSSYTQKALNLENARQSVSGVDLNDEATNMMMFQKSYAAACQLMTTLDSMLDKLINGTIR